MNFYRFKAILFIIFSCFLLQTVLFAQSNIKITIKKKNMTLQEALQEVEKQSTYLVAFNESKLEKTKRVDLNINAEPLEKALDIILSGTGLTFKIKDKYIMIIPVSKSVPMKKRITGVVRDANGEPLIGVNVSVKGTSSGTVTNLDGEFSLEAAKGEIVEFSYIGYTPGVQTISDATALNVVMKEDSQALDEVVVTALGIKRAEKALSYNVQKVKSEDITGIKDANFVNSLNGKVAGVTINTSSSGVGGASRVVMRGTKSIEQSSNALYVIDGIPMYNFGGGGDTEFGSKGATEAIADINPDAVLHPMEALYSAESRARFFPEACRYDYIVDAIDLVSCKLDLAETALKLNIPLIAALGTGNKLDPTLLQVTDISKTYGCPLARVMRKELRTRGIHHLKVVFSPEKPVSPAQPEAPPPGRRSVPASNPWVPATAGLLLGSAVVRDLIAQVSLP